MRIVEVLRIFTRCSPRYRACGKGTGQCVDAAALEIRFSWLGGAERCLALGGTGRLLFRRSMTEMTEMIFSPQSVLKRKQRKGLGENPCFGHFGHKIEIPTHATLQLPARLSFQPRSLKRLASNLLVSEKRIPFSSVHCW